MELDDKIYKKICKLIEKGDNYFERDNCEEAVKKYKEAFDLIPAPKTDWEASTYICVAIGEVYFYLSKMEIAIQCFEYAMLCPDGIANPLIHLRLGQCFYEEGNLEKSKDHLFRAYMLVGDEIFEEEEDKYYHLIETEIDSEKLIYSAEKSSPEDGRPVSGLEPEVESLVDALMEKSNYYFDRQDYHSAKEYLINAWNALPEGRYAYEYSYLIACSIIIISLKLKDIDDAKRWVNEFKLCDPDRFEDGYREMKIGIVCYEDKDYETAKRYFDLANTSSMGRCFLGEDKKYKEFYDTVSNQ